MKKPKPKSTRGRKPNAPGTVRSKWATCYLLESEVPIVAAAARERGLSQSDLLRAGLVALGVPLSQVEPRKPARAA